MFEARSLKFKITGAFVANTAVLLIVGGITYYYVSKTMAVFNDIVSLNIPNLKELNTMHIAEKRLEIAVGDLIGESNTAKQLEEAESAEKQAIETFDAATKRYEEIPFEPGEEEVWKAFYAQHWKPFVELSLKIVDLSKSRDKAKLKLRDELGIKEFAPRRIKLEAAFEGLKKFQESSSARRSEEGRNNVKHLNILIWALISTGALVLQVGGHLFSKQLSRTLQLLASRLGNGANSVAAASKQIFGASSSLSESSTEQAAALQQTVSSVDEISAMINKNADNAKKSQDVATRTHEATERGKQAVQQMISAIDEISQSNDEIEAQIENSNREISNIVNVIAEISNKTKVINDIVFQTKLLSFNASVEAARAGENGKGFAVVAEEVGNLAQMSGNAAKEISQLLEGSIHKVEKIVNETKEKVGRLVSGAKTKVHSGTETAQRCGSALNEIVKDVSNVRQMVDEIATASQEQSQGVQEITKAMAQLDQVTQQNAASSRDSANASESLSAQAEELRTVVSTLIQTVKGSSSDATTRIEKEPVRGKPDQTQANVVQFPAKKQPSGAQNPLVKKAVGSEEIPSENDSRFEDA